MLRLAALLGIVGLAAATAVIIYSGWAQVLQALAQAGWCIPLVALVHLLPMMLSSTGWRFLMPGHKRPSWPLVVYFMWIRASVNNLMPVARIGGEIAAVRVMTAHGMRQSVAIGSTVVELTLSIVAIFTFVVSGVILFALHINDSNLTAQLVWGLLLALPVIAALIAVQKIGFFDLLSRLFRLAFRDKWAAVAGARGGGGARLDRVVTTIYLRHGMIAACWGLQFLSWSLGSVEIALTLAFLGHPLPFMQDIMLEALVQGSAMAAFAIPGALGVQEAGFLFFGGLLGLPHDSAAALAVIRRCRDLIVYTPGLIAWQAHEGKKLWRK